MTEAWRVRIRFNTGKVFVEPNDKVSDEHYVVTAVHCRIGSVAVPEFPNGRRPLLNHITPAREIACGCKAIGDINSPHIAEQTVKPLGPNETDADMSVRAMLNVVRKRFEGPLAFLFRNKVESERENA